MNQVQVTPNYWYKIIDHYHNLLNEKFLNRPLTPYTQHFIRQTFEAAVNAAKAKETHPAWHIPLALRFDLSTHQIIIEAADSSIVQFI
jgi:hypothetical protein